MRHSKTRHAAAAEAIESAILDGGMVWEWVRVAEVYLAPNSSSCLFFVRRSIQANKTPFSSTQQNGTIFFDIISKKIIQKAKAEFVQFLLLFTCRQFSVRPCPIHTIPYHSVQSYAPGTLSGTDGSDPPHIMMLICNIMMGPDHRHATIGCNRYVAAGPPSRGATLPGGQDRWPASARPSLPAQHAPSRIDVTRRLGYF